MPKVLLTFFIVSLLVLGCQPTSSEPQSKSTKAPEAINSDPKPEEWPPEKILKDPQGYCKFGIETLASQLQVLNDKKAKTAESKQELLLSSDALSDNLAEISNLLERSKKCYLKAKNESRWPAKCAGHSYSEDALKTVISKASKYLEKRELLAKTYKDAHRKIDTRIEKYDEMIEKNRQDYEKLSINLERIIISQGDNALEDINQSVVDFAPITDDLLKEDEVDIDILISDSKKSEKTIDSFIK